MNKVVDWLLEGPPWVRYRVNIDLLGLSEGTSELADTRKKIIAHPDMQALLSELSSWPGPSIKRHNDAGHLLHKLVFIADVGIGVDDPGVSQIVRNIIEHRSKEAISGHC